jgi:hypothetical protein
MSVETGVDGTAKFRLPARTYRLYLITDGQVTIPVRLRGPSGKAAVSIQHPAKLVVKQLTPRLQVTAAQTAYVAGASGTLTTNGMEYVAMWVFGAAHVAGYYGDCFYERPPESPLAYGPGCPGAPAAEGPTTLVQFGAPYGYLLEGSSIGWQAGTPALGTYYVTAAVPELVGSMGFWLSYS